jgi:hypothetical protein
MEVLQSSLPFLSRCFLITSRSTIRNAARSAASASTSLRIIARSIASWCLCSSSVGWYVASALRMYDFKVLSVVAATLGTFCCLALGATVPWVPPAGKTGATCCTTLRSLGLVDSTVGGRGSGLRGSIDSWIWLPSDPLPGPSLRTQSCLHRHLSHLALRSSPWDR